MIRRKLSASLCLASLTAGLTLSIPAHADDDKAVGILAGLGVAAASGKTSLGQTAGGIEAGLLGVDNFQMAGAILASVVNKLSKGHPVIVLTHDEKVDFASWQVLVKRMDGVQKMLAGCPQAQTVSPPVAPVPHTFTFLPKGTTPLASDFIGAGLTDMSIGGIALTADDRLLETALMMNAKNSEIKTSPISTENKWQAAPEAFSSDASADFIFPSDTIGLPQDGQVWKSFTALTDALDKQRSLCSQSDGGKAVITIADTLIAGLTNQTQFGVPLVNAAQTESVGGTNARVLRVAIEQVGGTSIARTGIPYTFGWPDAATVGAGLLVSFRLTDPGTGKVQALGLIRCMMGQSNIKRVADIMKRQDKKETRSVSYAIGKPYCDYRVQTLS